jgi:hypothetical protein
MVETGTSHFSRFESSVCCLPSLHRVIRVVTAAFWRTFYHEGKIGPGWCGWGVHAHPLSLHLPSSVKLQCTLQPSGQIHQPCFISNKNMYSVDRPIAPYVNICMAGFCFWGLKFGSYGNIYKKNAQSKSIYCFNCAFG